MIRNVISGVKERSVLERAVVDRERQAGEVRLAADRRDERRDQVGDDGRHDGGERGADDDGDRQVDQVAPGDEVPEALHVHDPLRG